MGSFMLNFLVRDSRAEAYPGQFNGLGYLQILDNKGFPGRLFQNVEIIEYHP